MTRAKKATTEISSCSFVGVTAPDERIIKAIEALALASKEHAVALTEMAKSLKGGTFNGPMINIATE